MAIAIILTAVIMVYWAYGYSFNTKTGDVVENGLLFVDSKPSGATVYLNGEIQSTTASRSVLRAGVYDLVIKKDGYRDWQRKFTLGEHSVSRIVYPFLFPKEFKPQLIKSYQNSPLISVSLDRKWLLAQIPATQPGSVSFEQYDTAKPTEPPKILNLSSSLFNNAGQSGSTISIIEWSGDSNRLLLKHSFNGGVEFVVMNREDPTASFNVNKLFNFNPEAVSLFDRKTDQLYLYTPAEKGLFIGDVAKASLQPILKQVLAYKAVGEGVLIYVTNQNLKDGQYAVKLLENNKDYQLDTFPASDQYVIDGEKFQSHWYFAVTSDASGRVNIFKDPLDALKNPKQGSASPLISLLNTGQQSVSFSINGRFISSQAGSHFIIYDIEEQTRHQFSLNFSSEPLKWMDGHRLTGVKDGSIFVVDFDSNNQQTLEPTSSANIFFDRDYNRMFNLVTAQDGKSTTLQFSDLRAGRDLP